jgi:hypothetical protein
MHYCSYITICGPAGYSCDQLPTKPKSLGNFTAIYSIFLQVTFEASVICICDEPSFVTDADLLTINLFTACKIPSYERALLTAIVGEAWTVNYKMVFATGSICLQLRYRIESVHCDGKQDAQIRASITDHIVAASAAGNLRLDVVHHRCQMRNVYQAVGRRCSRLYMASATPFCSGRS